MSFYPGMKWKWTKQNKIISTKLPTILLKHTVLYVTTKLKNTKKKKINKSEPCYINPDVIAFEYSFKE